jgi:hypothetical protein
MKTPRLLSFLRGILYFAAGGWALFAVFYIGSLWGQIPFPVHPKLPGHQGTALVSGLQLETFANLDQVTFRGARAPGVFFSGISASLMVGQEGTPKPLLALLHGKILVTFIGMLLESAVCLLLGRLFAIAREGEAYSARCVGTIRVMGWCLLAESMLGNGFNNLLSHLLAADLGSQVVGYTEGGVSGQTVVMLIPPQGSLDASALLFGLFAFALAEVFNQGLRLREENALTV